ncbi:uncharacterized protein LOC141605070 [Silene latifolia]|uniref:uncharacterized protein LOC141605070 n=1 Tax=Silene latifolia TaxID=37657 RepID=UPI003D78AE81
MSVRGKKVNELKWSLKLMVDSKRKQVVFAEAGKDFVDFLFYILSLPLATVVKLLNNEEMTGSLPALYKSVESLKTEYFEENVNKNTVLVPKHLIDLPLLSFRHAPATLRYFKCPVHNYVSCCEGVTCVQVTDYDRFSLPCFNQMTEEVTYTFVSPESENNDRPGFVKKSVPYIVMDNLEVHPMSLTLIKSFVSDFDCLGMDEVQFGLKEGLALLKASLETNKVLTTVFLGWKMKTTE